MDNLDLSLQNARILCIRHKYEEAKKIYDEILEKMPMHMEANLGLLRIISKNFTDYESEEVNEEIRVFEEIFYDKDLRKLFPEYNNFLNKKENNNVEVVDAEYIEEKKELNDKRDIVQTNSLNVEGNFKKIQNTYSITINKNEIKINEIYDKNISNIEIPEGVTEIAGGVFKDFGLLTSIKLPKTLKKIGKEVFKNCKSLVSIEIPDGITEINESTFEDCISLKNVYLPQNISLIGHKSFYNCVSLKEIDLPSSLKLIDGNAFGYCNLLNNIVLINPLIKLNPFAFNCCAALEHVDIPFGVTTFLLSYFRGCISLKTVELPKSITYISNFDNNVIYFNEIKYDGEIGQWKNIKKDYFNSTFKCIVHCIDGDTEFL